LLCTRTLKNVLSFIVGFFPIIRNWKFYKLIEKNEKTLEQVIQIWQKQVRIDEPFYAKDILDLMIVNQNSLWTSTLNGSN